MKKVTIALMALVLSTSLFSCTGESISETDDLYDTHATEGDDEQVKPSPEDD
ncbi:hypothetical protein [Flavivirga jejuensis]|uniref:Secreted protein n=1 Tax=Flavivirga jejuensis TaxID=870487 RepID=A0ABT8WRV2_9FLAO|nr:hypothetical protein [Flavivirga jejuensis]MDO5975699.1 hypothetical protein [Flavivirga jejuensis]